ncbi:MAG: hypothetical protein HQK55_17290, partial [Deltaproteobacteria bacterium]|nr:hypothetical protein [Deltaproteobacteria bacterium]
FELEDLSGQQRVLLSTPTADTYLHLGAPKNLDGPEDFKVELSTQGSGAITVGEDLKTEVGRDPFLTVNGQNVEKVVRNSSSAVGGDYQQTIEGNSSINVTQAATQIYGSTLTIMAEDSIKQACKKDVEFDIKGNNFTTITGKDSRTVGHKADTIMGVTETTRLGAFNTFTMGLSSNMNVGAVSNINVAGISNVNLGAASTINAGALATFNLGAMFNMTFAVQLVYENVMAIKVGRAQVDDRMYSMSKTQFQLLQPRLSVVQCMYEAHIAEITIFN